MAARQPVFLFVILSSCPTAYYLAACQPVFLFVYHSSSPTSLSIRQPGNLSFHLSIVYHSSCPTAPHISMTGRPPVFLLSAYRSSCPTARLYGSSIYFLLICLPSSCPNTQLYIAGQPFFLWLQIPSVKLVAFFYLSAILPVLLPCNPTFHGTINVMYVSFHHQQADL